MSQNQTLPQDDLYSTPESAPEGARLLFHVPMEVKSAFQALCAKKGTTMSLVLRKFVEREVAKAAQSE